jgi:hypothetical protein
MLAGGDATARGGTLSGAAGSGVEAGSRAGSEGVAGVGAGELGDAASTGGWIGSAGGGADDRPPDGMRATEARSCE